jgi:hypothetical protein
MAPVGPPRSEMPSTPSTCWRSAGSDASELTSDQFSLCTRPKSHSANQSENYQVAIHRKLMKEMV